MRYFTMRKKSYAKVTLSLYAYWDEGVLKFKNVIVPIDLFDVVYVDKNETMTMSTNKSFLPNDKRNTVYKAIMLMKDRYQIEDNFKVHIVKNIPAQSGLGGGSANAATIINMINDMYALNLSIQERMDLGKKIDEDTPYCILNEPALVEGIGEIITPIQMDMPLYYLLIKPNFGISTKRFLKAFEDTDTRFENISNRMREAVETSDYEKIVANRYNSFQKTVQSHYEPLQNVIDQFDAMGLDGVCMTGSGSCIVGLSQDKELVMNLFESVVFDYPFAKYGVINPMKTW